MKGDQCYAVFMYPEGDGAPVLTKSDIPPPLLQQRASCACVLTYHTQTHRWYGR